MSKHKTDDETNFLFHCEIYQFSSVQFIVLPVFDL